MRGSSEVPPGARSQRPCKENEELVTTECGDNFVQRRTGCSRAPSPRVQTKQNRGRGDGPHEEGTDRGCPEYHLPSRSPPADVWGEPRHRPGPTPADTLSGRTNSTTTTSAGRVHEYRTHPESITPSSTALSLGPLRPGRDDVLLG